ncbi:hypothetical protein D915_003944 [Fasciola hepatica]|uniref:Chloride intracellular channel exc-4 n=1 Tax=Fasciola hepatica TaxID=6192 RepID=A0A4E0RF37_FASHE|nr:hypothetical protein D915_003944 [Fasciola hepatica]
MSRKNPLVRLYVPISHSASFAHGPCPLSQKWIMIYHLLVRRHLINLYVVPISPDAPPEEYLQLNVGRRLPLVTVTASEACSAHLSQSQETVNRKPNIRCTQRSRSECRPLLVAELEEDRDSLLDCWNEPGLTAKSPQLPLICDLASGLNQLLLYGHTSIVLKCLQILDEHLKVTGKRFLDRDEPGYADCALAPKLQHLRVAGAYFRGFHIPTKYAHLWAYIGRIYQLESFLESCPTDRDILLHYVDRILIGEVSELSKQKSRILQIPDRFRLLTCPQFDQLTSGNRSNASNSTLPRYTEQKSLQSFPEAHLMDCHTGSQVSNYGLRKFANMTNLVEIDGIPSSRSDRSPNILHTEKGINGTLTRASSASLRSVINYSKSMERPNPLYRQVPPSKYFESIESLIK